MPSACYPFLSTVTFSKGERMRPALLLLLAILLHVQPVSAARSFVDIWDDAVPLLQKGWISSPRERTPPNAAGPRS